MNYSKKFVSSKQRTSESQSSSDWIMASFLSSTVLLAVSAIQCALASDLTQEVNGTGNGCTLLVPPEVQKQMEPRGEPLRIYMDFMNIRIRDVPTEGGSYGVEFRSIFTNSLNIGL